MHFLKCCVAVAAIFLMSGCVANVETQVDAYSSIPLDLPSKTIYISAYNNSDAESLEWQTNAKILKQVIEEKGYTVVQSKPQAS